MRLFRFLPAVFAIAGLAALAAITVVNPDFFHPVEPVASTLASPAFEPAELIVNSMLLEVARVVAAIIAFLVVMWIVASIIVRLDRLWLARRQARVLDDFEYDAWRLPFPDG